MIDQDEWILQIRHGLCEDNELVEEESELRICVFNVPKELLVVKTEAYIPQSVSIGPYHRWKPELYEMERYKVGAARRYQKRIAAQKFEVVVEELRKYEWQIRSCYHKYLDFSEEALALLMALDAAFVLECLQFYAKQADKTSQEVSSEVKQLGNVLDPSGRSAAHNAIMKDLMMLENQIPLFVLRKLLEMQLLSEAGAEERLCNMVTLACKELSPFMFKMPETSKLQIKDRGHILEVLYYSLVPVPPKVDSFRSAVEMEEQPLPDMTNVQKAFNFLWRALSALNVRPIQRIFQVVIKLPLRLVSALGNLPVLRALKGPILIIFNSFSAEKTDQDGTGEDDSSVEIPPTRDELDIASISSLYSAGVKFLPTDGDLTTIRFDQKTATLYLPKVKLDATSEVVLRNLVAFEASASPGAFIFTRYTDLMNGMIDSAEDVRLLRSSGIIYNYLESNGKAASMWNNMGKCVKLTKVKQLDEVIAEVNKFHGRKWRVALEKSLKTYVFDSWKILSLFAAFILLALTCLQAFCSAYDCKRWFSDTDFVEESERLGK
ncbi:hypothetical protein SUGI_0492660 [Cryptomeria japonica]|uniref:putative UPF0481 protein At3g02645 n=1 Tax=Cryptomeria japonica TaxID=3369 RepID=UPI002408D992|nr:putative UPF0481 protein At3g02645 [Cryptomeria japonica]GLJ25735.1 hypothetical protein SUGI_0492660 [Cryptomeria japonica]